MPIFTPDIFAWRRSRALFSLCRDAPRRCAAFCEVPMLIAMPFRFAPSPLSLAAAAAYAAAMMLADFFDAALYARAAMPAPRCHAFAERAARAFDVFHFYVDDAALPPLRFCASGAMIFPPTPDAAAIRARR